MNTKTIFVTVGTGKFESLTKEMDNIAPKLNDQITIQIGSGKYEPKNCKWFRFSPNLNKHYAQADLIIAHGGPGTVFEILDTGKKFIACANRDRTDPLHQVEFLEAISKETKGLMYCAKIEDLFKFIQKSRKTKFEQYKKSKCWMDKEVTTFIKTTPKKISKFALFKKLINSYINIAKTLTKIK